MSIEERINDIESFLAIEQVQVLVKSEPYNTATRLDKIEERLRIIEGKLDEQNYNSRIRV